MNNALNLASTTPLQDDVAIPRLGLGVFRTGSGRATVDAVTWALERGYRHIDTAHIYQNEQDVGEAVRTGPVPRNEIFITTKLWNDDHGYDRALRAFDASLAALQVDVLDLYLMHWPVEGRRLDSWRAMERLFEEGRTRAIGVGNFVVHHLEELFANANIKPHINQIELHTFCQQRVTVDWCREHGVVVEAYSPVAKGRRLDDPTVQRVAAEVSKSAAQVLIRWGLQKGFVVIPKSANRQRIDENASVFDWSLSNAQVQALDALEANEHLAWDPARSP